MARTHTKDHGCGISSVEMQLDGLYNDAKGKQCSAKYYQDLMAEMAEEAVKAIHLGCLEGASPYRGIFATGPAQQAPSSLFTAWSRVGSGSRRSNNV